MLDLNKGFHIIVKLKRVCSSFYQKGGKVFALFDNLKLNNLHADEVDPALQIWMTRALLKTGTSNSHSKQYLTTIQCFTLKDFKCAYTTQVKMVAN